MEHDLDTKQFVKETIFDGKIQIIFISAFLDRVSGAGSKITWN